MLAGLWRHCELFDGTYSFEDLLDVHELLDVKAENERRTHAYYEAKNASHHA